MESYNLLEEFEVIVSNGCVWEVCDVRITWPGDDGYNDDTDDNRAPELVYDEKGRNKATAEDSEPHSW